MHPEIRAGEGQAAEQRKGSASPSFLPPQGDGCYGPLPQRSEGEDSLPMFGKNESLSGLHPRGTG